MADYRRRLKSAARMGSIELIDEIAAEHPQACKPEAPGMPHPAMKAACRGGDVEVVRALIRNGVPPTHDPELVPTVVDKAVNWLHQEVVDELLKHGWELRPEQAAILGRMDALRAMCQLQPSLITQRVRGATLLHAAVFGRQAETTRWLIENGASVDSTTKSGLTPLAMTPFEGRASGAEVARILLEAGASADVKGRRRGKTVLDMARDVGDEELVAVLEDALA